MPSSKISGTRLIVLATLSIPRHLPPEYWIGFSRRLAESAGLTALRSDVQRYEPQGMTVTTYLAESHITIETYPEDHLVEIELASCKKFEPILLSGPLVVHCLGPLDGKLVGWTVLRKNKEHAWRPC